MKIKKSKIESFNFGTTYKRPDLIFIAELIILGIFSISAVQLFSFFNKPKPIYTDEEFNEIKNKNITEFSVENTAKINLEIKSLEDFNNYFKFEPYSDEASGVNTLLQSAVMLPIIMFFIIFVMPPIVIAYILWFIIKYWEQVFIALIEFVKMIIDYSTDMIEGMLASKWWIRKFTHWHHRYPVFGPYFSKWRRKYVDRPMYNEQIKYAKTYFEFKRKYIDIPYHKYITVPKEKLKVRYEYAKKIYFTRVFDIIFGKLLKIDRDKRKIKPQVALKYLKETDDKKVATVYSAVKKNQTGGTRNNQIKLNEKLLKIAKNEKNNKKFIKKSLNLAKPNNIVSKEYFENDSINLKTSIDFIINLIGIFILSIGFFIYYKKKHVNIGILYIILIFCFIIIIDIHNK
jgi:hypothetical protein